jgi:cell division protein FtsQ
MSLNLKQIQANVEKLPYVAEAQVQRQLPNRIKIRITERVPIAKLIGTGTDLGTKEVFYIDRDGILLKPRLGDPLRDLPEIVAKRVIDLEPGQRLEGAEVLTAINLLKLMELTPIRASLDVRTIDARSPFSMKMHTAQASVIMFRLDHLEQQLQRLTEILEYSQNRQRQINTIDLTPDRNVPVTFLN